MRIYDDAFFFFMAILVFKGFPIATQSWKNSDNGETRKGLIAIITRKSLLTHERPVLYVKIPQRKYCIRNTGITRVVFALSSPKKIFSHNPWKALFHCRLI